MTAPALSAVAVGDKVTRWDIGPDNVMRPAAILTCTRRTKTLVICGTDRYTLKGDPYSAPHWRSLVRPCREGDEDAIRMEPLRRAMVAARRTVTTHAANLEEARDAVARREAALAQAQAVAAEAERAFREAGGVE